MYNQPSFYVHTDFEKALRSGIWYLTGRLRLRSVSLVTVGLQMFKNAVNPA